MPFSPLASIAYPKTVSRLPLKLKLVTAILLSLSLSVGSSQVWAAEPEQDNAAALNQATGKLESQEVFRNRMGDFDVSVMVDHAQEHKLSPQEQAILDEDFKKRQQQERATHEALTNPQSSQQFLQNAQEPAQAQDQSTNAVSGNAPFNGETNSSSSSTNFENELVVDMVLTKQNLQLNVLPSPTAPSPFTQMLIEFERPKVLQESFIMAGDKMVLAYSEERGTFAITFSLSPVSVEQQQAFQNYDNFKQALTQRFRDKDNLLYGEYEILDQQNFPGRKELSLSGYLKKSNDGILPDMQNYFYERTVLDKGYLATINCEFRGSQNQAHFTAQRAANLADFCERVLNSYKYQFKGISEN